MLKFKRVSVDTTGVTMDYDHRTYTELSGQSIFIDKITVDTEIELPEFTFKTTKWTNRYEYDTGSISTDYSDTSYYFGIDGIYQPTWGETRQDTAVMGVNRWLRSNMPEQYELRRKISRWHDEAEQVRSDTTRNPRATVGRRKPKKTGWVLTGAGWSNNRTVHRFTYLYRAATQYKWHEDYSAGELVEIHGRWAAQPVDGEPVAVKSKSMGCKHLAAAARLAHPEIVIDEREAKEHKLSVKLGNYR